MCDQVIEELGSVEFGFKKAEGRGMRSVDVIGLICGEEVYGTIDGEGGYIVREVRRRRDLKGAQLTKAEKKN